MARKALGREPVNFSCLQRKQEFTRNPCKKQSQSRIDRNLSKLDLKQTLFDERDQMKDSEIKQIDFSQDS
jgi:hypothetical protein